MRHDRPLVERLERGGVELAQSRPQRVGRPSAHPVQVLVAARQYLDCLGELAVSGDRPVLFSVGAYQVGQHLCVCRVALGARAAVPVPVPRNRLFAVEGVVVGMSGDWNSYAAVPSASATSPTTSPEACSRPAASDPDYTLIREEPRNRGRG